MADKGFDLKVLIPTDDGLLISANGVEKAKYYLMYNLSNRSYQLAGKIKTTKLLEDKQAFSIKIENLILLEKIDKVIDFRDYPNTEISEILNSLIDLIDKKNELN